MENILNRPSVCQETVQLFRTTPRTFFSVLSLLFFLISFVLAVLSDKHHPNARFAQQTLAHTSCSTGVPCPRCLTHCRSCDKSECTRKEASTQTNVLFQFLVVQEGQPEDYLHKKGKVTDGQQLPAYRPEEVVINHLFFCSHKKLSHKPFEC